LLAEEHDPVPEQPLEELVAQRQQRGLRGAREDLRDLPVAGCHARDAVPDDRFRVPRRVVHGAPPRFCALPRCAHSPLPTIFVRRGHPFRPGITAGGRPRFTGPLTVTLTLARTSIVPG